MKRTNAIVSQDYHDEYARLALDRHIQNMALDVYKVDRALAQLIAAGEFVPGMMNRVLDEYKHRAVHPQHRSIGGPYEGLRIVLNKLIHDEDVDSEES